MKKAFFYTLLSIAFASQAYAAKPKAIFPKNNLWIGPNFVSGGIARAEFDAILVKMTALYEPVAAAEGYHVVYNNLWDDGTVNSDTDVEGDQWVINSYGGLARYNGMTVDAYAGVACHEMGHHTGGAPLYAGDTWASNEGEADYHTTIKCLHKYFKGDDNIKIASGMKIDPTVVTNCTASFVGNAEEIAVCERSSMAGYVLADVLDQLEGGKGVAFNTPDKSEVNETNDDHPAAQCRLDTYFQGALCTVSPDIALDKNDWKIGACLDQAMGERPRCWFKPPSR